MTRRIKKIVKTRKILPTSVKEVEPYSQRDVSIHALKHRKNQTKYIYSTSPPQWKTKDGQQERDRNILVVKKSKSIKFQLRNSMLFFINIKSGWR